MDRTGFARKVPGGRRSRAKAQSAAAFLRVFFAPLRLCVRNRFFPQKPQRGFEYFSCKSGPNLSSVKQPNFLRKMTPAEGESTHRKCPRRLPNSTAEAPTVGTWNARLRMRGFDVSEVNRGHDRNRDPSCQ